MRRIALLFPGQGAQEVGMGRDLLGHDPFADQLMALAEQESGRPLNRICQRGPARELDDTSALQPALSVVCLALWHRFAAQGPAAVAVAGHSLGELPALAAAGIASPEAVVRLAVARGRAMGEAATQHRGSMTAVTGVPLVTIEAAVAAAQPRGIIAVAAVNAPDQATISGDPDLVTAVADELGRQPGARVTPLKVTGAWHCEAMRAAVPAFAAALQQVDCAPATTPFICNRTGREVDTSDVPTVLAAQLISPVRFDLVVARLVELGVTEVVELGPGKVLRGLLRLNGLGGLPVHNVSDLRSLERCLSALAEDSGA